MRQALHALGVLLLGTMTALSLILGIVFSATEMPHINLSHQTTLNDFGADLEVRNFELTQAPTPRDEAGEIMMVATAKLHGCKVEVLRNVEQELAFTTNGDWIEVYAVRVGDKDEDYTPFISPKIHQVEEFLVANRYPCYSAAA